MTEPTKINRWLIAVTLALFLIAGSQAYLLSQKSNDRILNSQPNLLNETNNFSNGSTLKNWDPLSEIQNIQKNMDRFFGQSFNNQFPAIPNFDLGKMSSHQMDIKDEGNNYLVTLEVKGLKETDLNISVKDQTLNISGTIEKTIENKNDNSFSRQFSSQHFQQMATLPGPVKPETVTVSYKGDSLKIQIEKT
jgi:HSP20 family protein